MTYDEALLTLAKDVITGDYDTVLSDCDNFTDINSSEKEQFRSNLIDLLGEADVLVGKDVETIVDKFNFEKVEPLKAILEMRRNIDILNKPETVKGFKAYQLISDDGTEYYNDIERATMIRTLSIRAIATRDLELINFMLEKVQKFGV